MLFVQRAPKSITEHPPLCLSHPCPRPCIPAQPSLGPFFPAQEMLWRILSYSLLLMNCCLALLDWLETWLVTLPLPDCWVLTVPFSACPAWLLDPQYLQSSPVPADPLPSGFTHTPSPGCLHSSTPITAAQKHSCGCLGVAPNDLAVVALVKLLDVRRYNCLSKSLPQVNREFGNHLLHPLWDAAVCSQCGGVVY